MEWITDPAAWWLDPFVSNGFMRNALWAGLLVVATTFGGRTPGWCCGA